MPLLATELPKTAAACFPHWLRALCLAVAWLAGCRGGPHAIQDPEYRPIASTPVISRVSHESVAAALMPVAPDLGGEHELDEYVQQAVAQNPQIQAKRKRVEAMAQRVPQAASLKDPTIATTGYPFYPHVQQTAGGRMTVEAEVSQEVPWFGKLRTQACAAEAEVDMARADLLAAELEVVEQVKRAYYELYYVQRASDITEESRRLAVDFSRIAETKYKAAQVSQQDLLRAELEVSNVDTQLVRLRQELQSAQARLARLLHVSPDTPVRATRELPGAQLPKDLERLYARAIAARPELHSQLAAIRRDRHQTDFARLQYFPDVTFSAGWGEMTTNKALSPVADGIDNYTVGMMANIPIYYNRLSAGVREAEAKSVASAREYDTLRDRTQEDVKDLFAQATSQAELLRLFRDDILPKAEQTLEVSVSAYEAGRIDFLQLIDNWQQLLKYRLMSERLEAQLRQTLAALERLVGGDLPNEPAAPGEPETTPAPVPPEPEAGRPVPLARRQAVRDFPPASDAVPDREPPAIPRDRGF